MSRRLAPPPSAPRGQPPLWHDETLRALVDALDLRERETAGHSHRVATWTLLFAALCGVPRRRLAAIWAGALLHDVGKIAIPDRILLKHGRLDGRDWRVMRTHPEAGRALLARTGSLRSAIAIPWCHHERWDGAGYPRGLRGARIPLGARLFAIVDVYDALRSRRPYKRAFSHRRSQELVAAQAGRHFDPDLCRRFLLLSESALRRTVPRRDARHGYAEAWSAVERTLRWLARRTPATRDAAARAELTAAARSFPTRRRPRPRG